MQRGVSVLAIFESSWSSRIHLSTKFFVKILLNSGDPITAPKCFWPSVVIVIPVSLKMSVARSFISSFTIKQDFVAFGLYPRGGPCLQISSHKFLISCNFPAPTRSSAYAVCLAPVLFWLILFCRTDKPSAYAATLTAFTTATTTTTTNNNNNNNNSDNNNNNNNINNINNNNNC